MSHVMIAALALSLPIAAGAQSANPPSAQPSTSAIGKRACAPASAAQVDGGIPTAGVHKLGEMPPARQYLTVLREIDGCPKPVVLREGIGRR